MKIAKGLILVSAAGLMACLAATPALASAPADVGVGTAKFVSIETISYVNPALPPAASLFSKAYNAKLDHRAATAPVYYANGVKHRSTDRIGP